MIKSNASRRIFFTFLIFSLFFCLTYSVVAQEIKDNNVTAAQEDLIQSESRGIANSEAGSTENQSSNEKDNDLEEGFDLDEQSYEGDDDDFVPTEEIPADEPIPFPTNI